MLVTKKDVGDIFLPVGDMPIGHQHIYMSECDVGDRFVMLETFFELGGIKSMLVPISK